MNKELIKSLAKLAKVKDVEAFTKALESESDTDFKLDTDNLIVRTKEEDSQFKENILESAKTEHYKAAMEIQIKNMKKDLGLEFEGKKPEDLISAYKAKILEDAKVEPNKKIEELNTSLETLRTQLGEKDNELSQLQKTIETDKRKYKAQSLIPDLPDSIGLSKEEATSLYFMSHEIKEDGIYKNGEKLKDSLEKPISFEDSIKSFVEEKGWNKTQPSGRGGGAQGSGGHSSLPTTLDEYDAYIKEKGYSVGSQEANAVLAEMTKTQSES